MSTGATWVERRSMSENILAHRYRIERELGQAAWPRRNLAADLKHDPKVAIKVLKPELADLIGVRSSGGPTLADDPRVYAYGAFRFVSRLYTVDGVR